MGPRVNAGVDSGPFIFVTKEICFNGNQDTPWLQTCPLPRSPLRLPPPPHQAGQL